MEKKMLGKSGMSGVGKDDFSLMSLTSAFMEQGGAGQRT